MFNIDDIIDELYSKYQLDRTDIARMVKTQFKEISNSIRAKGNKTCNLIYIGKFKNTPYRVKQLKQQIENGN